MKNIADAVNWAFGFGMACSTDARALAVAPGGIAESRVCSVSQWGANANACGEVGSNAGREVRERNASGGDGGVLLGEYDGGV